MRDGNVQHRPRRPEPAVAAANAGKHVVVEKPLEITPERCDRIIDACDKNKTKLCTIFPSRFGDANRALKQAVEAGRFGRLPRATTMNVGTRTRWYCAIFLVRPLIWNMYC